MGGISVKWRMRDLWHRVAVACDLLGRVKSSLRVDASSPSTWLRRSTREVILSSFAMSTASRPESATKGFSPPSARRGRTTRTAVVVALADRDLRTTARTSGPNVSSAHCASPSSTAQRVATTRSGFVSWRNRWSDSSWRGYSISTSKFRSSGVVGVEPVRRPEDGGLTRLVFPDEAGQVIDTELARVGNQLVVLDVCCADPSVLGSLGKCGVWARRDSLCSGCAADPVPRPWSPVRGCAAEGGQRITPGITPGITPA